MVTHRQLLEAGLTRKAIKHRVGRKRLYVLWRGVYGVVRPPLLSQPGWWMAATLVCGPDALLSHASAATLWRIRRAPLWPIHVSVPRHSDPRHPNIRVHRRLRLAPGYIREKHAIRVTSPAYTITDIAPGLTDPELEAVINEADKLDLVNPADLRADIDRARRPGVKRVRNLLDKATFVVTESDLERRFIPIAKRAGLPMPVTQISVAGYRVDFYWPDLELAVETDGARFHRTAFQQTEDRRREHALTLAGIRLLRFTHAQVRYDPAHVERTLRAAVTG